VMQVWKSCLLWVLWYLIGWQSILFLQALLPVMPLCPAASATEQKSYAAAHLFTAFRQDSFL